MPLRAQVFEALRGATDTTGRSISALFLEPPPAELYPDYYEKIQMPLALNTVEEKLRNAKYSAPEELVNDFELMFANARAYNRPDALVYHVRRPLRSAAHLRVGSLLRQDAAALRGMFKEHMKRLQPSLTAMMEELRTKRTSTGSGGGGDGASDYDGPSSVVRPSPCTCCRAY